MELIEKQQAIDAVTDELDMIDHVPQWVFDRLEGRLKQLPPAQLGTNLAEVSTDTISRQAAMKLLRDDWQASESRGDTERAEIAKFHFIEISNLPAAQPEQHIDADGTLWVTVTDIEQVKRVIVDEEKSKFCRQFYMDAQPEPCEDDPRADVYYLAEKIGINQLYELVVQLRGEPEPCEDAVSRTEILRMINCINDHHAITPYKSVGAVTEHLTRIASSLPPVAPKQPDCAKCKSELANKIRGQQDNPGMLTENDKGRNWGLEWAAQIVEGKRR